MNNAILVIFPYRHNHTWVFDDKKLGIIQEPFVSGIPEMIDILVKDINNCDEGFKMIFSSSPFPGYQAELIAIRPEYNGYWYHWEKHNLEGWLCSVLFKYFDEPPQKIYCQAQSLYY